MKGEGGLVTSCWDLLQSYSNYGKSILVKKPDKLMEEKRKFRNRNKYSHSIDDREYGNTVWKKMDFSITDNELIRHLYEN